MMDESDVLASEGSLQSMNGLSVQQSFSATDSGRQTFIVQQGNNEYEVEALHHDDYGNRTVEEFYGYGDDDPASANTPNGMERENVSQLFFYKGPEKTSLVIIHDEPRTTDGGEAIFEFDNLPSEGEWSVPDDSGDNYSQDRVHWNWYRCCTDGGVYGGGFETAFYTAITPHFRDGINDRTWDDEWVLVDGSGSTLDRQPLDTGETVQIGSLGNLTSPDDANFVLDLPFNPCITTGLRGEEFCLRGGSVVKLGPRECSNARGGKTPPLASVDISYFETDEHGNTQYSRSFWVGVELEGRNPCIWVGEEDAGACSRVTPTCGSLQNVVADNEISRETARDIANALLEAIAEIISDLQDRPLEEIVFTAALFLLVLIFVVLIGGSGGLIALLGVGGGFTASAG